MYNDRKILKKKISKKKRKKEKWSNVGNNFFIFIFFL